MYIYILSWPFWGRSARKTQDFRLKLARLILALAERKPEEVARYESVLAEMGLFIHYISTVHNVNRVNHWCLIRFSWVCL